MALTPTPKMTVLYVAQNPSHQSAISGLSFEDLAEQSGRSEQQNQEQQSERYGVAEIAGNIGYRQHFGKAQKQAADECAADVAHAAQDNHGNAFMQHWLAHER